MKIRAKRLIPYTGITVQYSTPQGLLPITIQKYYNTKEGRKEGRGKE